MSATDARTAAVAAAGNILDDSSAIEILTASKVLADDIAAKQVCCCTACASGATAAAGTANTHTLRCTAHLLLLQDVAEKTEAKIDKARQAYLPVADYTSSLYFCIVDMGAVDPMYAYSLEWFVALFVRACRGSKPHGQLGKRIQNLNSYVTELLFKNVCRSLFEKDKTLFSFLLAVRVVLARGDGSLTQEDVRFLSTGGVASSSDAPSPLGWVPDNRWGELCRLAALAPALTGLPAHVRANGDAWRAAVSGDAPEEAVLPGEWSETVRAAQPRRREFAVLGITALRMRDPTDCWLPPCCAHARVPTREDRIRCPNFHRGRAWCELRGAPAIRHARGFLGQLSG